MELYLVRNPVHFCCLVDHYSYSAFMPSFLPWLAKQTLKSWPIRVQIIWCRRKEAWKNYLLIHIAGIMKQRYQSQKEGGNRKEVGWSWSLLVHGRVDTRYTPLCCSKIRPSPGRHLLQNEEWKCTFPKWKREWRVKLMAMSFPFHRSVLTPQHFPSDKTHKRPRELRWVLHTWSKVLWMAL